MTSATMTNLFDLYDLPFLSMDERRRLGGIQHARSPQTKRRSGMALCNLLLDSRRNDAQGWYLPLSNSKYLKRKLTEFPSVPISIDPSLGTPLLYFGNPLLLPEGQGKAGFCIEEAPQPIERVTNGGFLIVTLEYDPKNADQFR